MSIYAHNFFDRDQRVTTTPNCHKLSAIAVVPRFITRQMDEGSSVSGSSSSSSRSSGFVHNVVADRSFVAARRPVLSFLGCARLGFVSFRRDSSRPGRRLLSLSLSLSSAAAATGVQLLLENRAKMSRATSVIPKRRRTTVTATRSSTVTPVCVDGREISAVSFGRIICAIR